METLTLDNDISVFYVTARSFPEGIEDAFKDLNALMPYSTGRKYFGISRPENGTIVYRAAVEELVEGEAEKFNCGSLIIRKGNYISVTINDFMKDISAIGKTFKELITYPGIDPEGYCVELYLNDKDVRCMVRLKDGGFET